MSELKSVFRLKEMEEKEGEKFEGMWNHLFDNKMGGEGFGEEGFGGKIWKNFAKNTISPKVGKFERKTLVFLSFPFPSLSF